MVDRLAQALDTSCFRIVDSHCHLGGYNKFHIPQGDVDDLVRQMDEIGVEKMAVSPLGGLNVDCRWGNNETAAALKRYPGRFLGMAVFNPNREEEIIPELERCFDQLGMSMIKIHPDEAGCPMTRSCYDRVLDFAGERGLAIMNHDWQSPSRLEQLVGKYPKVRFVQAHSAGNWDGRREDDYFRLARDCGNVYVDVCASPIFYNALEKLVDLVGAENILFGSDAPFLSLSFGVAKVLMAQISDEAKQNILADNFLRMLEGTS